MMLYMVLPTVNFVRSSKPPRWDLLKLGASDQSSRYQSASPYRIFTSGIPLTARIVCRTRSVVSD